VVVVRTCLEVDHKQLIIAIARNQHLSAVALLIEGGEQTQIERITQNRLPTVVAPAFEAAGHCHHCVCMRMRRTTQSALDRSSAAGAEASRPVPRSGSSSDIRRVWFAASHKGW
jgi:hypothetical protein